MARKRGGEKVGGPFVPVLHDMLDCPAWRSLPPVARLLYIAVKRRTWLENNGRVFLSVRDAAEECGAHRNTIMLAFRDLQARGFLVAMEIGHLGVEGQGKATTWRLTELGYIGGRPTKEYLTWSTANEFPVRKASGPIRKNQNPVTSEVQSRHKNCDVFEDPGTSGVPSCHKSSDVSALPGFRPVTDFVPHLESARGGGRKQPREKPLRSAAHGCGVGSK
jgi:hypothetical protein